MAIHITKTFNQMPMPQLGADVPTSVKSAMQQIVSDRNALASLLNGMKDEVMRGSSNSSNVTINIGSSSGSGGGSSSSGTTIQVRANTVSLTANVATTITFSSAFTASFVIPSLRCYDSAGAAIGFDISNITATSFQVTAMDTATLEYLAIEVV